MPLGVPPQGIPRQKVFLLLRVELDDQLLGERHDDLGALGRYVEVASRATGVPVPSNYPVFGKDAFETATGVHAAAIVKALAKGDAWLADRIYSGVPAGEFGRKQEIGIGFMSGASNVNFYLRERGVEPSDELVASILAAAKRGGDFLLLAQMPEPQPAWCQQYHPDMHPVWARKFEPPAIACSESES